jgi:glutamate-1-semialdehyde 2,1-aminomutase
MTTVTKERFKGSEERFARARLSLAGGVSSGLRSAAKPLPLYFSSGQGSKLVDVDGNQFIDYTLAWGPLILGHCHPRLNEAMMRQLTTLQQVGAQHYLEIKVAELICTMVPCAERVLFSNTGTEAVQTAIRLARAFTGRNRILRFEGHYHGWADNALLGYRPQRSPSDPSRLRLPTEGMNPEVLQEVIVLPWNDVSAVERILQQHGEDIACILTEPILCNSGCILPAPGFLQALRELATQYGVVLIFDEVITGFRVATGGAQALYDVTPDLATFAKAIAAGLPLSAIAGSEKILSLVEQRRVVHAGTYNGNALSLAAANATLTILSESNGVELTAIRCRGERLMDGLRERARAHNIPIVINGVGAVFWVGFAQPSVMENYSDTLQADSAKREEFLLHMLDQGYYLLPDGRWYLSTAHTDEDIDRTLTAIESAFEKMSAPTLEVTR